MIRLKALHNLDSFIGDISNLSLIDRGFPEDRKLSVPAWRGGLQQGQLPREMIERGPEIVEEIANDEAEPDRRLFPDFCAHDVPLVIRVWLLDELVRNETFVLPKANV